MTNAIPIPNAAQTSPQVVATSMSPRSPDASTLHARFRSGSTADAGYHIRMPKALHPTDNDDLKLLILENISQEAVEAFRSQGFHVDHYTKAMSEDELVEKIGSYHAIGIRSKTKITERVIKAASKVGVRLNSDIYLLSLILLVNSYCSSDASALESIKLTCSQHQKLASQCSTRHSPTLVPSLSWSLLKLLRCPVSSSNAPSRCARVSGTSSRKAAGKSVERLSVL